MNSIETRKRSGLLVVALCFLTIVADGYDLIVYGASVPQLLTEPGWHMSHDMAGMIGSWTLIGLMIGAMSAGPLTDRFGRRRMVMIGVAWFSAGSLLCAFAPNLTAFGVLRFLTGVGLGGVVPSVVALTIEYAPKGRRQLYNGLMLTGYSVGGILSAVAAMALLPNHGWRVLFGIAGLFVLVLPLMYLRLPESVNYLLLKGRVNEARGLADRYGLDFDGLLAERSHDSSAGEPAKSGYRELMARKYALPVIFFVLVYFCSQLIVYGLNTWLPQLMREAGYPLGSSLAFLLVLQIGAVIGMVGGSVLADRFGPARVIVPFFLIGAISLLVLSRKLDATWLMIAVAGAGLGTIGTSSLTYGYVAASFPASCRATAVGVAMGLGRAGAIIGPLMGGWILSSSLGYQWNFYGFAIPAIIAAVLIVGMARFTASSKAPVPHSHPVASVSLPREA